MALSICIMSSTRSLLKLLTVYAVIYKTHTGTGISVFKLGVPVPVFEDYHLTIPAPVSERFIVGVPALMISSSLVGSRPSSVE